MVVVVVQLNSTLMNLFLKKWHCTYSHIWISHGPYLQIHQTPYVYAVCFNYCVVGVMILSYLNFSVNFLLVGIKCLQFLMTFPFSFRISCIAVGCFVLWQYPFCPKDFVPQYESLGYFLVKYSIKNGSFYGVWEFQWQINFVEVRVWLRIGLCKVDG